MVPEHLKKTIRSIYSKDSRKPIMKIGRNSIQFGSVVKLKKQNEISNKYAPKLARLIADDHRFVVSIYFKFNQPIISVRLLSTSDFMNQTKQLGLRLETDYGKYGNGKQVYVDQQKLWVIKKNCIKSFEYELSDTDKLWLFESQFSSYDYHPEPVKGILDSGALDLAFEEFLNLKEMHFSENEEIEKDLPELAKTYADWLTYDLIKERFKTWERTSENAEEYDYLARWIIYADLKFDNIEEKREYISNLVKNGIKDCSKDFLKKELRNDLRGYRYRQEEV